MWRSWRRFARENRATNGNCGSVVKDPNNVPGSEGNSPAPGLTSSGLLEGVKAHDPEAWRRLALLYGPLVYQWCRGRGLQAGDAEDVLQEVFLTVATRVGEFRREREGDTFRGWLWTITRNKIGDWIRRQRSHETAVGGTEAQQRLEREPSPEEALPALEGGEAGGLYRAALDLIRPEFEERSWLAFWQVVLDGRAAGDVADELHLTRNAVYIAKSRVLRRLREVLGDD